MAKPEKVNLFHVGFVKPSYRIYDCLCTNINTHHFGSDPVCFGSTEGQPWENLASRIFIIPNKLGCVDYPLLVDAFSS